MGSISRIGSADRSVSPPDLAPAGGLWRRVLALVTLWRRRAEQRRQLGVIALDPHMLRDLGLTQDQATREIHKAFWRP